MKNKDIRWHQRFNNYAKALSRLNEFIEEEELNELEEQGLIKAFEYTYELAWNTIKDFYENQGDTGIQGSKDAFRLAINRGLLNEGETWMQMVADRNKTSHSYDEETAREIVKNILEKYYNQFFELKNKLLKIKENEVDN
jgi:nucleotidyltransferase substrate binding protein (TIGR01987 family)